MRPFSKFRKGRLPTVGEEGAVEIPSQSDPEKGQDEKLEGRDGSPDVATIPSHIAAEIEKSMIKKLDRRLISLVFVLYLLSYLDRSNIGNAKIAGLDTDLHLSSPDYQWLLTIFYISYIVFEWFAMMWKILPPHIWAAFCVLGWGLTATLQSTTHSFSGLLAARFFLGFFEAGYGPGIPYLLSFFYLRHEIGFRTGIFLSAAPLATCFAGALAYGITSDKTPVIANWRLLFLVEGLPTIVAAGVTFFALPDSPETASFLTEEEKVIARARGVRQVGNGGHEREHVNVKDITAALLDPKNYLQALMYFSCNVSFSSLPVFLPTILSQMGFSPLASQGLTAPPYFLAFLLVLLSTYIADRTQQRGYTIIILSLIGFIGYILLATTNSVATRYLGVFLAASGVFPSISNILPWTLNNQGSDTKRGMGIAMLNLIGQCGPLLGTRVFPGEEKPFFRKGMWVCAAFMLLNGCLALGLRYLLKWENGKLDATHGKRGERAEGETFGVGEENDGPGFRYVL